MKRLTSTILAISAVGTVQVAGAELRDAGNIKAGGFVLTPTLKADVGYDDNINTTFTNENSANVYKLAPELNAKTKFGDHVDLNLDTKGEKGVYAGQASNNYYDYSFSGDLGFRISNKQRLGLNYAFTRDHNEAGSPGFANLAEFRQNSGGLTYSLGSKGSVARLEAGVNGYGTRYKTAADAATRDVDATTFDVAVYSGVAPRTEVLVQVLQTENDYTQNNNLDNDDQKIFVGVEWEATAKTTGKFKIGQQTKEPTGRAEEDTTAVEASVRWEPLSYSAFTLDLGRDIADGTGITENSIENTRSRLGWEHKWTGDVKTNAGVSMDSQEYLGVAGQALRGLETDTLGFDAGVSIQVERNFTLTMSYKYEDKDADLNGVTDQSEAYTRSSAVLFGAEIGL